MNPGEMKKLKIYLDTSVINFLFADDSPEKQEITIEFLRVVLTVSMFLFPKSFFLRFKRHLIRKRGKC